MDTYVKKEKLVLTLSQVFLFDVAADGSFWSLTKGEWEVKEWMGIFGDQVVTKLEIDYIQVLLYIKSYLWSRRVLLHHWQRQTFLSLGSFVSHIVWMGEELVVCGGRAELLDQDSRSCPKDILPTYPDEQTKS